MGLRAESKLYKHPGAKTLYLTIPSKLASDSQFPFKPGDVVSVNYYPHFEMIIIRKKEELK